MLKFATFPHGHDRRQICAFVLEPELDITVAQVVSRS